MDSNASAAVHVDNENGRPRRPARKRRRWLRRTLVSIALLFGLAALVLAHSTSWTAAFGGEAEGPRLARMQASPNFSHGRFRNGSPGLTAPVGSQWEALKSFLRGAPERHPAAPLPTVPRAEILGTLATPPPSGLRVTWLGHSTLLIEIDGRRFLTDPMFSARASPSTLLGTKRFQPPALRIEDLPALDAVLLSHDHYDHLDLESVRALNRRGVTFYAPLGVGAHLARWGVPEERIVEHDWWAKSSLGDFTLVATPAHHFSGRMIVDQNRTLWCSWMIAGPRHRVFFSGDSGLSSVHQTIGHTYGPFDVAFMDIGASDPTWADIHFGPKPALEAAQMLGARRFIPIHWGTFNLALHAWDEPVETLLNAAAGRQLQILTPALGAPVEPETASKTSRWWRETRSR